MDPMPSHTMEVNTDVITAGHGCMDASSLTDGIDSDGVAQHICR